MPTDNHNCIVLVRPGGVPPATFVASILLTSPTELSGSLAAALDSARERIIEEITATWQISGTLMVIVAGDHADAEIQEHEMFWRPRVDVTLVWPVLDAQTLASLVDRLGRGRTPGWVVLGVPTAGSNGSAFSLDGVLPVVTKSLRQARIGDTVGACVRIALDLIGPGASRSGGHRHVPLPVWTFPPFRAWVRAQEEYAHNTLLAGRVEWVHHSNNGELFLVAFTPTLAASREQGRVKDNDVIIIRPRISAIVALLRDENDIWDSEVVIVGETRSAAMTCDGRVHEIPAGSSPDTASPVDTAVIELNPGIWCTRRTRTGSPPTRRSTERIADRRRIQHLLGRTHPSRDGAIPDRPRTARGRRRKRTHILRTGLDTRDGRGPPGHRPRDTRRGRNNRPHHRHRSDCPSPDSRHYPRPTDRSRRPSSDPGPGARTVNTSSGPPRPDRKTAFPLPGRLA